ncbi:MAG: hypothetical protein Q9195_000269 [Heterodermia aff. obscurata]
MVDGPGDGHFEIFVWWFSREGQVRSWVRRQSAGGLLTKVASNVRERVNRRENYTWANSIASTFRYSLNALSEMSGRDKTAFFILRPMDIIGSIWLAYIVTAQTFGSYQNCECMASTWGTTGGYMDFETYDFYRAHGVAYYWAAGTGLSTGIMGIAFAFVVIEYCTQSHLSTEDYGDAMQGLRRTRQFKKYTAWLRDVPDFIINIIKRLWSKIWRRSTIYSKDLQIGRYGQGGRRSLLWTWTTKRKRVIMEGIPLHRQGSAEHSRTAESSRGFRSPKDTEMDPYSSPISHEGDYPPQLPVQPVEIPLEEGRIRSSSYRRI